MRYLIVLMLLTAPIFASADVTHVFVWKPMPGKEAQTLQNGLASKPVHEKLGARVGIYYDQLGRYHYVVNFDNWIAWANFQTALSQSKEWTDLWASFSQTPAAELINVYLLEEVSAPATP